MEDKAFYALEDAMKTAGIPLERPKKGKKSAQKSSKSQR